jgi:hypothetical protein
LGLAGRVLSRRGLGVGVKVGLMVGVGVMVGEALKVGLIVAVSVMVAVGEGVPGVGVKVVRKAPWLMP